MLKIAEIKKLQSLCLQLWKTHVVLLSVDLSDQKKQEEKNINSI